MFISGYANTFMTSQRTLTPEFVLGANRVAMIGLRTNKENLPFNIEHKVRYSQLDWLVLCLFYKRNSSCFVVFI